MKRFLLDCAILGFFLYGIAFILNDDHSDLQDARITEDRIVQLGKEHRQEQAAMKKQERALRDQAALQTGIQ